ncbi:MAG: hypothetical protein LPJ89_11080, partial [Hymenobacteraceae bacterium]|nr:hypothetical protein [Hymenobacteraceae bacterium]
METRFLFPHWFKKPGWILFIPAAVTGLLWLFDIIKLPVLKVPFFAIYDSFNHQALTFKSYDLMDELLAVMVIVGGLLVACSKEKYEDEFIAKVRLESLLWA